MDLPSLLLGSSTRSYRCVSSRSLRPLQSYQNHHRSFFSLADVASLLPGGQPGKGGKIGDVQEFHARKILPYTQEQLYNLVADVPSYSSFIPFCSSSKITSSNHKSPAPTPVSTSTSTSDKPQSQSLSQPFDVQASLAIGFGTFNENFESRVIGEPYKMVEARAVDGGLFNGLKTTWSFSPASPASPHPTSTPTGLPSQNTTPSPSPSSPKDPQNVPSASTPSAATSDITPTSSKGPTLLTISLRFSFVNPLHQLASQAFLPKVEELMVGAFEKRCLEVYGKGKE